MTNHVPDVTEIYSSKIFWCTKCDNELEKKTFKSFHITFHSKILPHFSLCCVWSKCMWWTYDVWNFYIPRHVASSITKYMWKLYILSMTQAQKGPLERNNSIYFMKNKRKWEIWRKKKLKNEISWEVNFWQAILHMNELPVHKKKLRTAQRFKMRNLCTTYAHYWPYYHCFVIMHTQSKIKWRK